MGYVDNSSEVSKISELLMLKNEFHKNLNVNGLTVICNVCQGSFYQ
jgi:hypothetical protein